MAAMDPLLQERVYHALKADYLAGTFVPGRRLDIQELAMRHRASKTPVREAACIMVGQGLLVHHPDGGFTVPVDEPRMNRSVARQAFTPDLPDVLISRRTKGGPDAFGSQIIEHRRAEIRERLLDGRLAKHGVVDGRAIEQALSGAGPNIGIEQVKILHLVDAEAWAASWDGRTVYVQ